MLRRGTLGAIEEFELYDPRRTNQRVGFYFQAIAEYLPDLGGWLAQCHACGCLRCLLINEKKETWQCSVCNRSGTFKKIEAMNRKTKI